VKLIKCVKPLKIAVLITLLMLGIVQAQTTVKVLRLTDTTGNYPKFMAAVAEKFTAETGIAVDIQELENEDFKKKLPTLLQTDEAPDIFYSWGGGIFYEQANAGATRDVTALMAEDFLATQSVAGMNAFTVDGKIMGVAHQVSQVGFFYNKDLVTKAGVDVTAIKTWDDFLAAVQTVKDAGITPIAAGGADKWPLHFYWSYLAMRMAGQEGMAAAKSGEGAGFADEPFIKAGEEFKRLTDLEPFQEGFETATYDVASGYFGDGMAAAKAGEGAGFADEAFVAAGEQFKRLIDLEPFQEGFETATYNVASGYFGDGNAAFHLMGDWDIGAQAGNSASGEGLSEEQLGFFSFPAVEGGAGRATDTLGGINGFVLSKDAPDEAVQFLQYINSPENQLEAGKEDLYIPLAVGSDAGIVNPIRAQISRNLAESQWHQIFLDQDLGADVGGVVNDISLQLATGDIDPQGAAELIQEAWELR
jgi:raffinose/stachyose/melibiose transport system substrate-binding protein